MRQDSLSNMALTALRTEDTAAMAMVHIAAMNAALHGTTPIASTVIYACTPLNGNRGVTHLRKIPDLGGTKHDRATRVLRKLRAAVANEDLYGATRASERVSHHAPALSRRFLQKWLAPDLDDVQHAEILETLLSDKTQEATVSD